MPGDPPTELLPEGAGGKAGARGGGGRGASSGPLLAGNGEKGKASEQWPGETEPGLVVSNKRVSSNLSCPLTDFSHADFTVGWKHATLPELQPRNYSPIYTVPLIKGVNFVTAEMK